MECYPSFLCGFIIQLYRLGLPAINVKAFSGVAKTFSWLQITLFLFTNVEAKIKSPTEYSRLDLLSGKEHELIS